MKVIWFNGNLGNQIFYCRFKDYLLSLNPNERVYAFFDPKCPPIKVAEYTNLTLPNKKPIIDALSFFVFRIMGAFYRRVPKALIPSWYCGRGPINTKATFFASSLQDCFYYRSDKSDWLQINLPSSLSDEYLYYDNLIRNNESICIHVRRGDYIKPGSAYEDLTMSDYYERAIQIAKSRFPEGKLFFFSDDINYVKSRFPGNDSFFVNCNSGSQSYLDIRLMSLAKVNIIANSTFSYWAAYINNEKKTVIYPLSWFKKETGRASPNIMLDSWFGI